MNFATIRGRGASAEGEQGLLHGYNGTGAEVEVGDALCWDIQSSDGKTMTVPAVAANSSNFGMFAGLAQSAIGTADYSPDILCYGVGTAKVYGIATVLVPGANLLLVDAKSYTHYGSSGQFAGSTAVGQPITMTALATNATVDTTAQSVFIKAL